MLRRIVMTMIAAVAVGGFVFVFTGPTQTDVPDLPAAIESVSPTGGDLDLRQVTISADLAPGYTGILELDGVELPLDQQVEVPALNSITFRPQPGGDFGQIRPGPHCATIRYHRIGEPASSAARHQWCFRLH